MTDTQKFCNIKSCPFCSSDRVRVIMHDSNNYAVTCNNCDARGPAYGFFSTKDKIIKNWNNLIIGRKTNMVKTNLPYLRKDTKITPLADVFEDIANKISNRIDEACKNQDILIIKKD